jgi:uncharacterized protein YndB with AHSA1/START domain
MTDQISADVVRSSVTVQGPPERAFALFTEGISTWWPLQTHTVGAEPATAAVIEPRAGGRWFERAADGSETDWGHVLAWEPPHRVVLSWEINAEWRPDPATASEVEVSFHAEDGDRTRVELEHRRLEVFGDQAARMRDDFASAEGGWSYVVGRFADAAGAR